MTGFKKVSEPIKFGTVEIKNRFIMTLINDLEAEGIEFVKVGDSNKPGNALDAIKDGYLSVMDI